MKRVVAMLCIVGLLALLPAQSFSAGEVPKVSAREKGGLPAFFVGCCFGIREGTEWNEGKELHWREWIPVPVVAGGAVGSVLPYIGPLVWLGTEVAIVFFMVWNGVECATGTTAHQFAEKYGTNWY